MCILQIVFIGANITALAILAFYLYKQFEHKLDIEWKEFEKTQRSVEHDNTD